MTSKGTTPRGELSEPGTPRRTLRKTLGTSVALAASQGAAGLSFLVLARRLPIDRFGAFAALYAASTGVSTLLDFGSSQRWTRELAREADVSSYHHWLRHRTCVQLPIVAVLATLASVLIHDQILSNVVVVVLSAQALTSTVSTGALAAVRARISPSRAAWFVFIGNLFFLSCVVSSPTRSLLMAGALGATVSWLITAGLALASTRHLSGDSVRRPARNPWVGTAGFGLFGLAVALQPFDVVIVGAIAGASEAGRVSAVSKWIQPALLLSYAYGVNVFPGLANAKSDRDALTQLRAASRILVVVVAVCIGILVTAPWLVSVLLGSEYKDSVILLRLLAIGALPVAINQPCVAFLQARGQEHFLAVATLGVVGADLVGTALLAHALGGAAIPIVSTIGYSVLAVILVSRVRSFGAARQPG